jgi:hypothetical protein
MSELYFKIGETEGFTSKKLADKKSGYTNPIRELLQNSLDASKDAGNNKCASSTFFLISSKTNLLIPPKKPTNLVLSLVIFLSSATKSRLYFFSIVF